MKQFRWSAAVLPLIFLALGIPFLPLAGIQDDEALFATAIYHVPTSSVLRTHIFGREIPLMLLSYLGALKSIIYYPILDRIRPSYLTLRIPVLLVGAATVWLFFRLLEETYSRRAAWVGGVLLATDSVYLLTTCYDWGPVALQHLLGLLGMLLVVKFAETGNRSTLFWAFFWFGVALWDKALFIWFFSGLGISAIIVFPRDVWSRFTLKNAGLAIAAIIVGAMPLVAYNLVTNFDTFRSNSSFSFSDIPPRVMALRFTLNGAILFDYIVHAPWTPGTKRDPGFALFKVSEQVHSIVGVKYYHNEFLPALALALVIAPFVWFTRARKPMMFCLIAMAVAWLQMAVTENAGIGAHHTVLLWPLPHWFLAIALVEAAALRPLQPRHVGSILLALVVGFLAIGNLLLTNEYFYQLAGYGAVDSWSDAIFKLSDEAAHIQSPELVVDDWGILNPLIVLHRNRLPLVLADPSFLTPGITERDRRFALKRLAEDVWIGHTNPYQQWPGEDQRIVRVARSVGFEKKLIETVPDRNGRAVFEIFRFVPAAPVVASN